MHMSQLIMLATAAMISTAMWVSLWYAMRQKPNHIKGLGGRRAGV